MLLAALTLRICAARRSCDSASARGGQENSTADLTGRVSESEPPGRHDLSAS